MSAGAREEPVGPRTWDAKGAFPACRMWHASHLMDADTKRYIKSADTREQLDTVLTRLDPRTLSESETLLLARRLDALPKASQVRIAWLGNYTADPIPQALRVQLALAGIDASIFHGDYNQYFQDVLDPVSRLVEFAPGIVFLSLSLHELAPDVLDAWGTLSTAARRARAEEILDHVARWIAAALEHTDATLFVTTIPEPASWYDGMADASSGYAQAEFFAQLNVGLLGACRDHPRVYLVDLNRCAASFGLRAAYDAKMRFVARTVWSAAFALEAARLLARHVLAALGRGRKCLVLDLDNTLWGGVLGEEGVDGIRVGRGDAVGEAYAAFQRRVRALKERGVLLAINSKNNPEDVEEAFALRTDMPLQKSDFAIIVANWENKADNLRLIAEQLNIGIDSLVFVDDSGAECDLVRSLLPEVATIQLGPDIAGRAALIDDLGYFDRLAITPEDAEKTAKYAQERARESARMKAANLDEYLRGLDIRLALRDAGRDDVVRVHQLFHKTNQFNLTTKRYTLGEVEAMLADPACDLVVADACDRHGDLGTIGVYLLRSDADVSRIDSFLMSCRALGRGIETALLAHARARARERGATRLIAQFVPTKKNRQTADFYDREGFARTHEHENGSRDYLTTPDAASPKRFDWIRLVEEL